MRGIVTNCVFLLGLVLIASATSSSVSAAPPPDYLRDVQPILAEHCTQCHGADEHDRQGKLRVDLRDAVLVGGDSGRAAIVPGEPEKSFLFTRITSTNPDEVMPPPHLQKSLNTKQIETIRAWIIDGAKYESHWAFTPPKKPAQLTRAGSEAIDQLVRAKAQEKGLPMATPATAATLCRRVYLDLVGYPPSPAEITAFEQQGLAATVDRLLSSPQYGEKWARHWLDLGRYSDTNGYEKDFRREQWKWRDWVVNALNQDMPYDQFVIEQVAGDLFPHPTQQQIVATGFLRNSMINEEGAIVPEQFRMVEMFDRLDCLGKAVLGLSTQCSQCHSHKFDPLSQSEYYGMFAYLNSTYEAKSWVYTPDQERQIAQVRARVTELENQFRTAHPQWEAELAAWEAKVLASQPAWEAVLPTQMDSNSGLNHPTLQQDRMILFIGHTSDDVFVISQPELNGVTGLRIEALNHRELPFNGPGRSDVGSFAVFELQVFTRVPGKDWEQQKLVNPTADFSEPDRKDPDGKKTRGAVALMIDGSEDTGWSGDRGIGLRNQPSAAVVQFEQPLTFPAGTEMKVAWRTYGGHMDMPMIGCGRLSVTRQPAPVAQPISHAAILALQVPPAERSPEQQAAIFTAWRQSLPDAQALNDEIATAWKTYPVAETSILHIAEREPKMSRKTYRLDRGNWDQPLEEVTPHIPTAFHPFPADAPNNRLGFARWLADRRSPLTARVAVNRIWQSLFGRGLVETADDFGTRTPLPEHRELLDWLAVDFMEQGWSQKQILRTILLSNVYQQSSSQTPTSLEHDPRNIFLARGPRFRVDAEIVRDIALGVSGLLHHQLGGPSVFPPVPQNVLDYNYMAPTYWKAAEAPQRYRRSLYMFRKRSMPDPVMSVFDSPNADFACARRVRSNTPLAALTGLNEPVFVESARALALRILREGGKDDAQRIGYAFYLCTARQPNSTERQALQELLAQERARIAEGWLNPREIVTGDPGKLPPLPPDTTPQDAAAWTMAARVLLNLDETMTKR